MVDLSDRRRSGRRLVGSLRTLNRSSRRRVISSIDQRPGSGRGELDRQRQAVERPRHRSSTLSSLPLGVPAARAGACARTGEQLDRVGELERRELEQASPSTSAAAGWCTGCAGPGRRRATGPRGRRPPRRRARSCRGSPGSELARSRSKSAASLPHVQRRDQDVDHIRAGDRVLQPASQTPSDRVRVDSRRPTARATAVLPIPPGPTTSTSRSP